MKNSRKNGIFWLGAIFFGLLFTLAVTIAVAAVWVDNTFAVDFGAMIYTLLSPLKGTGDDTVKSVIKECVPPILAFVAVYCAVAFVLCQSSVRVTLVTPSGRRRLNLLKLFRRVGALGCVGSLFLSAAYADRLLGIGKWVLGRMQDTTIYEDYYVDPNTVSITAPEKAKNLIYIYLESGETTYASVEEGGRQPVNYIPNMTQLAKDNISFSDKETLGGFISPTGTTWTIAALFASTSGLPFAFPVGTNEMNQRESFATGVTALGDILKNAGYQMEFLCGSNADFGGRKSYFEQHGAYTIFDYYTAIEKGYIPADHYVWWGLEDAILYEIAKDEVTRLAAADEPFNLTFLTVDQHHSGGYVCELCGDDYSEPLGNVLACSDRLLADFIAWCEQQDFYEDTVIVITGDHPRMDNIFVDGVPFEERTIYNCFIHAAAQVEGSQKNRLATTMDVFPTTLAALGFTIEGDRLGLGTNLFSARETLAEQLGYDYLNNELGKSSLYYITNFS